MTSENTSLLRNRGAPAKPESSSQSSRTTQKGQRFKPRQQQIPLNNIFKSQRYWARFVIILAVVVIIYVSSLNSKERKFARQREVLPYRFHPLKCQNKGDTVRGCTPKNCGRYISDNLITEEELRFLKSFAEASFNHLEADQSATLDLHKWELSTGENTLNLLEVNDGKVSSHEHMLAVKLVKNRVVKSLVDRFDIIHSHLHLAAPLLLIKLTNSSQWEYSSHRITRDIHPAVFYTTTIYLGDHGKDFKGGRHIFIDDAPTNKSISSVEARAGRILGYTSGRENLYYVEPITSGVQYKLTFKFTCDSTAAVPEPWKDILKE